MSLLEVKIMQLRCKDPFFSFFAFCWGWGWGNGNSSVQEKWVLHEEVGGERVIDT